MQIEPDNSAFCFQHRRALRGHGPERKKLIDELRVNENMMTHVIIMNMSKHPDPKMVKWRKELEEEKQKLTARLNEICGAAKEPREK